MKPPYEEMRERIKEIDGDTGSIQHAIQKTRTVSVALSSRHFRNLLEHYAAFSKFR